MLLLCVGFSALWSYSIRRSAGHEVHMTDFGVIYFAGRSALHHQDPYNSASVLREFRAAGETFPRDPADFKAVSAVLTDCINLPTALFVTLPLAVLPWAVAQNLWMLLLAASLGLAACLVVDLAGGAPLLALVLAAFMLANCELLLLVGNSAGLTVSFCVIAAWCFLKRRYTSAGVALLAISLVIKPHDAGFVWLYFILAGGAMRKRAWQTLAVAAALGICAALWIAPVSPHWTQELRSNIDLERIPGGITDPSPNGALSRAVGQFTNLQAPLSVFRNDPAFYNPAGYAIAGLLILAWGFGVLRKPASREGARLALATIAVLTLLPVYHWTHDAKLLLLTLPACALLWAGRGAARWIAVILTGAAIFVTSDLPLAVLSLIAKSLSVSVSTLGGKLAVIFFLRPVPVILLALGCFYLWAFLRYSPPPAADVHDDAASEPATAAAT